MNNGVKGDGKTIIDAEMWFTHQLYKEINCMLWLC